jgi:uncharacterized membrane protein YidH (DUF202 family)
VIEHPFARHPSQSAAARLVTVEPWVADPTDEAARKQAKAAANAQYRRAKPRLDYRKVILRWLSISCALISAGITLDRALQYLEHTDPSVRLDPSHLLRFVGYGLAALGLGALCIVSKRYLDILLAIKCVELPPDPPFSLCLVVSVGVAALANATIASVLISGQRFYA